MRSGLQKALAGRRESAEVEERTITQRIHRLDDERHKLLQLHYSDALPADLFKQEQERIARELRNARGRLEAVSLQFETIEKNLDRALELARDCQTAYRAASAKVRRLFNQAFFTKIYVYDDGQVTHDLAEPFRTLLDARLPAELRGEHLDDSSSPDRARAERWWLSAGDEEAPQCGALGSNFDVVVGDAGFEPATPCL